MMGGCGVLCCAVCVCVLMCGSVKWLCVWLVWVVCGVVVYGWVWCVVDGEYCFGVVVCGVVFCVEVCGVWFCVVGGWWSAVVVVDFCVVFRVVVGGVAVVVVGVVVCVCGCFWIWGPAWPFLDLLAFFSVRWSSPDLSKSREWPPALRSTYLLGLLAMIKCSICSYQCDN